MNPLDTYARAIVAGSIPVREIERLDIDRQVSGLIAVQADEMEWA